jgi:hypothetical protein
MAIDKIPKVGKIYKTVQAAYNALKKGFKSKTKREPNPIEDKMIMEEAKTKIQAQGDNISVLDDFREEGIGSLASGTKTTPPDVTKGGIIQNPDVFGDFDEVSTSIDQENFLSRVNKAVKENRKQREPDLDRPFVTDDEVSAFTMEENARKLNKAKGFIDEVGAKTTGQKLFVADLVEDVGQGIFKNVDMGATFRSNMYDDLIDLGIDDDTVLDIMYNNTKSDDFGISMAKIKSNAVDKGVKPEEIAEVADFYERVFYQVNRPRNLKANGGLSHILGV